MGSKVYITRASDGCDTNNLSISLDEWLAYLRSDSELKINGFADPPVEDTIWHDLKPGLAIWLHYEGGNVWFDHRDGNIEVTSPDEPTIAKMKQIARRLQAAVVGDQGERY